MENVINSRRQISESLIVAVFLTLSGGFMDAYSYLVRDHVFANAQTGNLLLLGINLSTGNFSVATHYLFPILAFALGIALSEIIRHSFKNKVHFHWRQMTLLIEIVILIGVAFIPKSENLIANSLISFACGEQVESFRKVNGTGIATTMCIGNLRSATQSFCDYSFTKSKKSLNEGFIYFLIVLIFVIGAVSAYYFIQWLDVKAIMISSIPLIISFILLFDYRKLPTNSSKI